MHEKKETNRNWLNDYSIEPIFFKKRLYNSTINYLKKQKYIDYSKIFFLLNSFTVKTQPVCYVLIYKNKIVGFVGTIFSKKQFVKKNYLVCNIHSWLVDSSHRIASSLLFKKINEKKCFITVLSSLPRLGRTFLKLGFKKFIMTYKVVFIKKIFYKSIDPNFEVLKEPIFKKKNLNKKFNNLIKDYSNKKFKKFIFKDNNSKNSCLIIGNIVYKKKFFKTLNIIYCSNKKFLRKNINSFFQHIEKNFDVSVCGEYYLTQNESLFKKHGNISMIKSKNIYFKRIPKNFTFDLLYSEVEF